MDERDNELIKRVCSGDTEAFRLIIERHKAKVFYLGLRFFHNNEDAEDFSQEVFLRTFERLQSFGGEVPFGAWLYRIAFNCAVNKYHFDKSRLTDMTEPDLSVLESPASGNDPERALVRNDLRERVNDVLARLPDVYAIVVRMHFFDGLAYREISEITDIPVNTIKSHIARAKKAIKPVIEPFMPDSL